MVALEVIETLNCWMRNLLYAIAEVIDQVICIEKVIPYLLKGSEQAFYAFSELCEIN